MCESGRESSTRRTSGERQEKGADVTLKRIIDLVESDGVDLSGRRFLT